MNHGVLMGVTAVTGNAAALLPVLPLYLGAACWTVVYDTIYAYQDKEDDESVGVLSTARYIGGRNRPWLGSIATLSSALMMAGGALAGLTWPFFIGMCGVQAHLLWQVWTMDTTDRLNLTNRFVANRWTGWMVLAAICAGKLVL